MDLIEEKALCAGVLAGRSGAAEEFFARCHPVVKRSLVARCADGRSRAEAEDIASDLLADCFRDQTDQNVLRYYSGRIPLESWLCKVALNRLRNWWRSGRCTYERPMGGTEGECFARTPHPGIGEEPGDHEVRELLGDALLAACRGIHPRSLAMMRAFYLDGVHQVDIAARWGCSAATVSRIVKSTVATIRENLKDYLSGCDPDCAVTWEDLLQTGASHPELLVGLDARSAPKKS